MKANKILEILSDQNFWFRDQNVGISRNYYLQKSLEKVKTDEIIVVSGVRRSGKSTLLLQVAKHLIENGVDKKNILIVNFEDYRWEKYSLKLLEEIWETYLQNINVKGKVYLFLDEIHVISGWERFVRSLHEKKLATIFVSVSSSKLLSKEYATLLSGRYLQLNVFPLSFEEFLTFNNFLPKEKVELIARRNEVLRMLNQYMETGGFPKVALTKDEDLLRLYFETIVINDVAERYKVKKIDKLRKLAVFYLTNLSNKVTFNSTSKFLDLPLHTVERFSYYLQEAFMCFFVNAFSYSLKSQEKLPKKLYVIDTGLPHSIGFKFSEDVGRVMENVVFLQLKRDGKEVYYNHENEVNFVIKEDLKVEQLIQVTYASSRDEIDKREIKTLMKTSKKLKCKNLLVITWDYEDEERIKGEKIIFKPLWKWLLNKSLKEY
jgi:hypothetical protein